MERRRGDVLNCGEEENERHVLLECTLYERWREQWIGFWRREKSRRDPMEAFLGYEEVSLELERMVLEGIGAIWRERDRKERGRRGFF